MAKRDYRNVGRDISHAVRRAMRTGDFENLGNTVRNTVRDVTNEVEDSFRGAAPPPQNGRGPYPPNQTPYGNPGGQPYGRPPKQNTPYYGAPAPRGRNSQLATSKSVTGGVMLGAGLFVGIPTGVAAVITTIVTLTGYMAVSAFAMAGTVLYLMAAGFGILATKGAKLLGRVGRYRKYLKQIQGGGFCPVKQLAESVQKPQEFVVKDLKKLMAQGYFPDAHMDEANTTFMMGDETYQAYLDAEEARRQREAEEARRKADPMAAALAEAREEGDRYIKTIRDANDAIPGEEISGKLDRLEAVCVKIFDYVEERPKKLSEIRRFMQYYLPTTLKLVDAYQEFDSQPVQGENIKKAKGEIERTLDTINVAFENLLDSLFQDDALDVSTDISALETMLAQEGLTGGAFDTKKKTAGGIELNLDGEDTQA